MVEVQDMDRCRVHLLLAAFASLLTADAAAQSLHVVQLSGFGFVPANQEIRVGDSVRWVWLDGIHNVESGTVEGFLGVHDGNFRSGDPTGVAGTTFTLAFTSQFLANRPMSGNVYPYYCAIHGSLGMVATISVLLPGDVNRDGQVDLDDHAAAIECLTGPQASVAPPACSLEASESADLNGDGDVDLQDLAAMQVAFTG